MLLLLLLDSQNGLNARDSTLDNDFSLWSIHTCNLLCKIRHVVVVLFHLPIAVEVSKVPPGFELMIIPGTNFNQLSRAHERYS